LGRSLDKIQHLFGASLGIAATALDESKRHDADEGLDYHTGRETGAQLADVAG
jgi:hypothetical protein